MTTQRRIKALKYYFIDMNSPSRFKKLKVSQACNFCRKRKSKCDVGTPGLHPCSNCLKANVKCIFSRASSPSPTTSVNRLSVSRAILPTVVAQDTIPALGYNQHDHRHKHHHFLQYPASDAYISPSVSLDEQYCDSYFFRHPNPVLSPDLVLLRPSFPSIYHQEDKLLIIYETDIQPFYPLLPEDTLRAICQPPQPDQSQGVSSIALRYAIFAVAAAYASMLVVANDYYNRAVQVLHDTLDELRIAQIHLLLHKYHDLLQDEQQNVGRQHSTTRLTSDMHLSSAWTGLLQSMPGSHAHNEELTRAYAVCYVTLCLGKLAAADHTLWTSSDRYPCDVLPYGLGNDNNEAPNLKSLFWLVQLASLMDTYMHAYHTTAQDARQGTATYLHHLQALECTLPNQFTPYSAYLQSVLDGARLFVLLFHANILDYAHVYQDMAGLDRTVTQLEPRILRATIQGKGMAAFTLQLWQRLRAHMESFPVSGCHVVTSGGYPGIRRVTIWSHWERPSASPSIVAADHCLHSPTQEDDPDYFYDSRMVVPPQDNDACIAQPTLIGSQYSASLDPHIITPSTGYAEDSFVLDYPAVHIDITSAV